MKALGWQVLVCYILLRYVGRSTKVDEKPNSNMALIVPKLNGAVENPYRFSLSADQKPNNCHYFGQLQRFYWLVVDIPL